MAHTESVHDFDPTAESRKRDHIELAFRSQIKTTDSRFYYDPLFNAHPAKGSWPAFSFLNKTFQVPMWVSSMTGGTERARTINANLARACRDYGFGMGLGSCRQLLHADTHFDDFNIRPIIGHEVPLFANLGIAQLEVLLENDAWHLAERLVTKLKADGLIVHVNPMQEWLQPEGDRFKKPATETIEAVLEKAPFPIIVKEVGQGFGYKSLSYLLQLPLAALDFAAAGGTSFSKLELLRASEAQQEIYNALAHIGHTAPDMVDMTNQIVQELGSKVACQNIIVSGGITDFLDGFYCIQKLTLPAVYGQASAFLKHAQGDYDTLAAFVESQIRGLELAHAFLSVRG